MIIILDPGFPVFRARVVFPKLDDDLETGGTCT